MTGTLNNSVKIGGVTVFTYEGAEAAYKALSRRCYNNLTMEASVALSAVADVMHGLGYSWGHLEQLEIEAISV